MRYLRFGICGVLAIVLAATTLYGVLWLLAKFPTNDTITMVMLWIAPGWGFGIPITLALAVVFFVLLMKVSAKWDGGQAGGES